MITGMSWGALSYNAKVALARGRGGRRAPRRPPATAACCTAERENSPDADLRGAAVSRYGINVHHLRQADAIELTIGQGAKPGTGGLLLGSKVSAEIAAHARPAARRRSAQPLPAIPISSAPTT